MPSYYIQYSSSATPIEESVAADETTKQRLVHSIIDSSVGGSVEFLSGTGLTDIGYKTDLSLTVTESTLNTHSGLTLTALDFLAIKYKSSLETDGASLVYVKIGTQVVSKLTTVGEMIILRPDNAAGSSIKIYSTVGNLAKVELLWGKEN